jgi:DNA-binding NarL/FixJ family response regulator
VGEVMWEQLSPRDKQIVELLLRGYENLDIADQLHMPNRAVKAHLNRMFARFGITDGIKRVKLAVMFYRKTRAPKPK